MALSDIPEGQRARSDLEHVLAAGDRAKELVARILTFSNRTKLKREKIAIDKPVADAINYIRDRFPGNINFSISVEESPNKMIMSNETEIYQIVTNLCANSLQAMPESGGDISISLDYFDNESEFAKQHSSLEHNKYAKICVRDTGCGMDMSTIEKMYIPFFSTSRDDEGSGKKAGLGLTTVYNIVSSLEGVIYVDSTPNEGSCFEICIPLLDDKIESESTYSLTPPQNPRNKNILFIDDEAAIIEMAEQILQGSGYTVTSFIDGTEALEYFSQQPHEFDLIITDLIMPAITGTELASKLSAINPNIPIILTTGFSEKITAASCAQWGINAVINKPFSINDLLESIEKLS